jgi:acyl-CoA synthetase (AMP-forming)/AMP-acid ligase II
MARHIDAGTSPDGVIAILLPNCAWYPVTVLACQAAHRTCVLLDSNYPAERNAGIMRAARL